MKNNFYNKKKEEKKKVFREFRKFRNFIKKFADFSDSSFANLKRRSQLIFRFFFNLIQFKNEWKKNIINIIIIKNLQ